MAVMSIHGRRSGRVRLRALVMVFAALSLLMTPPAIAGPGGGSGGGGGGGNGGGSGGGGGGGGSGSGSVYSDLVIAYRDVNGVPILTEFTYPTDEGVVTEYCVQPISYDPALGAAGATQVPNGVDGRDVWLVPLMGELLVEVETTAVATADATQVKGPKDTKVKGPKDTKVKGPKDTKPGNGPPAHVTDETGDEPCDPQPEYASYVTEVDLERLNLIRTTDRVIARKLAVVEAWLSEATDISLDGAGRIVTDGVTRDAGPEYAAIFEALMTTGTLPGLNDGLANIEVGPPAEIGPLDAWELAAMAMGVATGKSVPVNPDMIAYYVRIAHVITSANGDGLAATTWPSPVGLAPIEEFVDFSGFTYDRAAMFPGYVRYLDVPTLTWKVDLIQNMAGFADLPPIAEDGVVSNIAGFAQFTDDVRAVVNLIHENDVIPGFYIDPITESTPDLSPVPTP